MNALSSSLCPRKCFLRRSCCIHLLVVTLTVNVAVCNQPLIDAKIGDDGKAPILKLKKSPYYIVRKRGSHLESLGECEKINPNDRLAILSDYEEAVRLALLVDNISAPYDNDYATKDHVAEFGRDRKYWIGLVDYFEEGEWMWLKSGGLLLEYDFWLAPQPDHLLPNAVNRKEHCVALWNPNYANPQDFHTFNDANCLNEYYSICENTEEESKKRKRGVPPKMYPFEDYRIETNKHGGQLISTESDTEDEMEIQQELLAEAGVLSKVEKENDGGVDYNNKTSNSSSEISPIDLNINIALNITEKLEEHQDALLSSNTTNLYDTVEPNAKMKVQPLNQSIEVPEERNDPPNLLPLFQNA